MNADTLTAKQLRLLNALASTGDELTRARGQYEACKREDEALWAKYEHSHRRDTYAKWLTASDRTLDAQAAVLRIGARYQRLHDQARDQGLEP